MPLRTAFLALATFILTAPVAAQEMGGMASGGDHAPMVITAARMLDVATGTMIQNPILVVWYVLAVCIVGLHVSHGFRSLFDSLGLVHERYTPLIEKLSVLLGVFFAAGYSSVAICAFLGILKKGDWA